MVTYEHLESTEFLHFSLFFRECENEARLQEITTEIGMIRLAMKGLINECDGNTMDELLGR